MEWTSSVLLITILKQHKCKPNRMCHCQGQLRHKFTTTENIHTGTHRCFEKDFPRFLQKRRFTYSTQFVSNSSSALNIQLPEYQNSIWIPMKFNVDSGVCGNFTDRPCHTVLYLLKPFHSSTLLPWVSDGPSTHSLPEYLRKIHQVCVLWFCCCVGGGSLMFVDYAPVIIELQSPSGAAALLVHALASHCLLWWTSTYLRMLRSSLETRCCKTTWMNDAWEKVCFRPSIASQDQVPFVRNPCISLFTIYSQ